MSKEWNDKVEEAIQGCDNELTTLFFETYPHNSIVVIKRWSGETKFGIIVESNGEGDWDGEEFEYSIFYSNGSIGTEHFYYADGVQECMFDNLDEKMFVLKQCDTFDEAYTFLKQIEKDGSRLLQEI